MGGGGGGKMSGLSWKITKIWGFLAVLRHTGPESLKNHKATKPAFNVEPSSGTPAKRNSNGVSLAGNDVPLIVLFGPFLP